MKFSYRNKESTISAVVGIEKKEGGLLEYDRSKILPKLSKKENENFISFQEKECLILKRNSYRVGLPVVVVADSLATKEKNFIPLYIVVPRVGD